jgi:hypothetical protein
LNSARNLIKQAKYDAAVQTAVDRKQLWPGSADRLYSVAQQLATIYAQMQTASSPQQSQTVCLRAAVSTLREAVAAGLSGERLRDNSLANLAGADDFRKLIDESSARAARPKAVHQASESRSR